MQATAEVTLVEDLIVIKDTMINQSFFLVHSLYGSVSYKGIDGIIGIAPSCLRSQPSFLLNLNREKMISQQSVRATSSDGETMSVELGPWISSDG